jgi:glycosyltransferase involved in cell wall biosynthesis
LIVSFKCRIGRKIKIMKITVIVCTYNRHQGLAKALEGLAASELPESTEWEVLVVDNNSSDQTREVIEDFCRRYPGRFRYWFEPLQGKSYALNAGIRESRSTILAFADDDAIVERSWLWNLTSALDSGEWAGAGGRIIPVWPGPLPRWLSTDDPHTMGPFVAFDLGFEAGPLMRPPYGANMAFRREEFEKYGGFRTDLGPRPGSEIRREDIEFANRLLAGGERLRYEPRAVVRHPVEENRMKKDFVLRWWFWYGYSEVIDSGSPPATSWLIDGIPLCLFRRLARWTLQWFVSIGATRRFSCRRNAWYIAGTTLACYHTARRKNVEGIRHADPEQKPPQPSTLT